MPRHIITGPDGQPEEIYLMREETEQEAERSTARMAALHEEWQQDERARAARPWIHPTVAGWLLLGAIVLALAWAAPRLYRPNWIAADPGSADRLTYVERRWFGATTETQLERRWDPELSAYVWQAQLRDGTWAPFFTESW
jgi:hypothetical protein